MPGVGHKTASVVMAQAFGVPAFPVDTHIHRLAYRWGLSDGKNVEKGRNHFKIVMKDTVQGNLSVSITDGDYSLATYRLSLPAG